MNSTITKSKSLDLRQGNTKSESTGAGVDIAAEDLTSGPIAYQAKKVKDAVENKNRYKHDQIFRGIVFTGVLERIYSVVPREQLDEKKNALVIERQEKMAQLDVRVAESLNMRPHHFEIVNAD